MCKISKKITFTYLLSLLFVLIAVPVVAYDFTILQKGNFHIHRDEFVDLRLTVFREYPYLYEGTVECEKDYIDRYCSTKNSVLIVTKDGERVIGAITGIPLNEVPEYKDYFLKENIPIDSIYYLGEIVLLKEYRGQGIGARMYEMFEQFVRENTTCQEITFCEIVSPKDGPRRTNDYFCLDEFWLKRGFVKHPGLVTQTSWKEVGSEEELSHTLVFWIKKNAKKSM